MEHSNLHRFNEIVKILKESKLINGVTPQKLCLTLEKLGPTFIKLGQILSTRVELLDEEYCNELSKLRNNVVPMQFNEVEEILNESYGNYLDIFSYVEKYPIGSASIAQVHRAILKDNNKTVVLKIKRTGIDEKMKTDLELFEKAIKTLHLNKIFKIMDLSLVLEQIYKTTKEELDFNIETNHIIEFRNNNKYEDYVSCPFVYKKICTLNVIVMEYVEGYKINDVDSLKYNNYSLELLGDILSHNYIKQALDDGFFHADPHPDNIIINENGIVYLDFGMMGRLNEKNKQLLKKCIRAIVTKDYKEVSRILVDMSTALDEVNYTNLENNVTSILEEYASLGLNEIRASSFITDMFKMLRSNNLVLDKDITNLIRGIGVIESVLKTLNPNMSLISVLAKSEENSLYNLFDYDNIKNTSSKIIRGVKETIELPLELSNFIKAVNRGESKFKVELSDSSNQVDKLENLVHELIVGFLDGCLIVSSVIIDNDEIRIIFIILIFILTAYLLVRMLIDHLHKGY